MANGKLKLKVLCPCYDESKNYKMNVDCENKQRSFKKNYSLNKGT